MLHVHYQLALSTPRRFLASFGAALGLGLVLLLGTAPSARAMHAGQCQAADGAFYACGELAISLSENTDDTIEEVIRRHGGDPNRDLLPVPPDAPMYAVRVDPNREATTADRYRSDSAVAEVSLNYIFGDATIPTQRPGQGQDGNGGAALLVAFTVLGGTTLVVLRVRGGALGRSRKLNPALRRGLGVLGAIVLLLASVPPASAQQADPYTGSWKWPNFYDGTYRYDASFWPNWMRPEADAAIDVISHSPYRNPHFWRNDSVVGNGLLKLVNSSTTSCLGSYNYLGCAFYSPSFETWQIWLANHDSWVAGDNVCWINGGAYATCSDHEQYDVWTVVLNEMGHVNTLGHHVNPYYGDAVVQAQPVHYPHTYWQNRSLRWADNNALAYRYGWD